MASNSRKQIEAWLNTIEVKGSVIDVGGLFWPVKGRTKTWEVDEYRILDVKKSRKGIIADYIFDMNIPMNWKDKQFDNVFCIEVTDHFWNPVQAFHNIWCTLKKRGLFYISSNFLFPHHTGFDCIRLTRTGLHKILKETGFNIISIRSKMAVDNLLVESMKKESKVVYYPGEIGYMVTAQKNG